MKPLALNTDSARPEGPASGTDTVLEMATRARERVADLLRGAGFFKTLYASDREMCVDAAFDELYDDGRGPLVHNPAAFRAQWIMRARWRAVDAYKRQHGRGLFRRSVSSVEMLEKQPEDARWRKSQIHG